MSNILILGAEGFIGSRLKPFLEARGHIVDGFDRGYYSVFQSPSSDFKYVPTSVLHIYDCVILLAAHSSVPLCEHDPVGSFRNNVENFHSLLQKVREDQKLVYISSGSVYGKSRSCREEDTLNSPICHYDMQKQMIDNIASLSPKYTIGLRLGTVCGNSPNPRLELMLNSMYCDAVDTGEVRVANPTARRAILGIVDLCRAISVIVESPKAPKGVYNLASIKGEAIHNLGQAVAKEVGAGVVVLPPTLTYDFMLNTDKFEETFDFRFQDTVESIIEDLRSLSPSMRKKSIFNRSTRLFKYE